LLIRLARASVLVLTVAGSLGCQALPQLPDPASGQSVASRVVAGATSSLCAGAFEWLKAEPTREVRLSWPAPSASAGDFATDPDVVNKHRMASRAASDQVTETELVVRDLPLPRRAAGAITLTGRDGSEFVNDRRSSLADVSSIVEATVVAADLAYDIQEQTRSDLRDTGHLDPETVSRELPGYIIQRLYVDRFSGLKAFALESRHSHHRIYAIAGTQVFVNRDYRDWASGLMMARPQFVSNASLLLVKDAADYAREPEHGGEVFFTGQSQGAVISQALGFLVQEVLNTRPDPHRLVHVVTWGATGATEPIIGMINRYRQGYERDLWSALERHWSLTDAEYPTAIRVWNDLGARWSELNEQAVADHVRSVARQMHVIGYFFDIDPFARIGTFLGQPLVFPVELVLPQRCEQLVTELVLDTRIGDLGLRLESHFLKGYRRAAERGAVGLARAAHIMQHAWVLDLLPPAEVVARTWLRNIYLTQLGESGGNWQRCFAADRWITDRNRDCRRRYWPGCDQEHTEAGLGERTSENASWCLVADDSVAPPAERVSR
jgi:hypothetical protein